MDSFKTYSERIISPTPAILGLKLIPYTLGHSMLLKSAKSVFVCGGMEKLDMRHLIGELVFAILVCSTTYDEFLVEMNNGEFVKYMNQYVSAINDEILKLKDKKPSKKRKRFTIKKDVSLDGLNRINLLDKIAQFTQYIKDGTSPPMYYPASGDENNVSNNPVELEQSIISTLMSECNFTRSECFNLPLTETLAAYLLYAYRQGAVRLESKEVFELRQRLKEQNGQSKN